MTTPTTTTTPKYRTFALVGAGVGLVAFLAVGLLPTILYGGYAGVILAGALAGTPVEASFAVRALIVAGMVLGVTLVAAMFAAAGAAAGTAIGALTGGASRRAGEAAGTKEHGA
jgi:hypothetical protein